MIHSVIVGYSLDTFGKTIAAWAFFLPCRILSLFLAASLLISIEILIPPCL